MNILKSIASFFRKEAKEVPKNGVKISVIEKADDAMRKVNSLSQVDEFTDISGIKLRVRKDDKGIYQCSVQYQDGLDDRFSPELKLAPKELSDTQMIAVYKALKAVYLYFAKMSIDMGSKAWSLEEVSFEDSICCLCYTYDVEKFLSCGHSFCKNCTKGWFITKQKLECPICRSPVDPRTIFQNEKDFSVGFKIINEPELGLLESLQDKLINAINC